MTALDSANCQDIATLHTSHRMRTFPPHPLLLALSTVLLVSRSPGAEPKPEIAQLKPDILRFDPFTWPKFIFRTLAGVYFAGLFTFRGFGITAGTHAFYDILVALMKADMSPKSPPPCPLRKALSLPGKSIRT